MKKILLLLLLSGSCSMLFSQQFIEKEKQIEVLETTEITERKTSVGIAGGMVQYFGEQNSESSLDYGFLLRNHISPKFDITFNFHLGEMGYKDSLDMSQKTTYYGVNSLFKLNLIETFAKKEIPQKISPYIGAGIGLLISKAPHYEVTQYVDFYFPVAIGVDINVSEKFIVGVNATGRLLFSDEWDNTTSSSANDILFNPSLSLKYVFAQKKRKKQQYVTKTIKYKEEVAKKEDFGKYEEKKIESFIEVSVKEIKDSNVVEGISSSNTTKTTDVNKISENISVESTTEEISSITESSSKVISSDPNYLFFTVQLGSYSTNDYVMKGITQDFEFYNKELSKYNYCKGFFGSVEEANVALSEIKAKGKKGYVIAIYKDERLKTYSANKKVASGKARVDVEAAKQEYLK